MGDLKQLGSKSRKLGKKICVPVLERAQCDIVFNASKKIIQHARVVGRHELVRLLKSVSFFFTSRQACDMRPEIVTILSIPVAPGASEILSTYYIPPEFRILIHIPFIYIYILMCSEACHYRRGGTACAFLWQILNSAKRGPGTAYHFTRMFEPRHNILLERSCGHSKVCCAVTQAFA